MPPQFTQLPLIPSTPIDPYSRSGKVFSCELCGTPFYRYLADIRKAESRGARIRFCSNICARKEKASTNRKCTCEQCGESFIVWASVFIHAVEWGNGAGRFCSANCRDVFMAEARRTAIMVPCMTCGKLHRRIPALIRERMFCSAKCMGAQVQAWARFSFYGIGGKRADIGNHYFRSRWEANIARMLNAMNMTWEYEPRTFDCATGFYTPDFLIDGKYWIEVKGYLTPIARAKMDAFRMQYPDERLVVIDRAMYKTLQREWEPRIPEWEHSAT